MEIFKIIIFEYIFGYILQGFSFVLGVFTFCHQKIILKKYLLTSIAVTVIFYLVRLLPISFGVHTILDLLFLSAVSIYILKMPIYATIRSILLLTIILLASEMANVALMIGILGQEEFERKMALPLEKAIVGLPGALTFSFLIFVLHLILNRPKKTK